MGKELQQSIIGTMQICAEQIRANMQSLGINASGRTSDSIHVRVMDDRLQIVVGRSGDHAIQVPFGTITASDTAPAPTLEIGRAGGAVPKGFYYIIREWSREKGLQFGNDTERGTFAYFAARKIAREGTRRSHTHVDVYSGQVNECVARIREMCQNYLNNAIRAAIGGFGVSGNTNKV